jgi:hypothetical protein
MLSSILKVAKILEIPIEDLINADDGVYIMRLKITMLASIIVL